MKSTRLALTGSTLFLAFALACGESRSPSSPSTFNPGDLGPDGSNLKIAAPALQSPGNGAQVQGNPVLVFTNVSGTYASFPVTYEVELRNPQNGVVASAKPAAATGGTTSVTITQQLAFDTTYSWRVRATFGSAFGPWSESRTFRTMPAGYINGNEVFDPLTNGKTVGQIGGPVDFIPNVGMELLTPESFITYALPQTLIEGEFSMMVTGIDDGSPGDKSKVMSMQEGPDVHDITDDDYRFTLEKRGRDYPAPGTVAMRVITGGSEEPFDTQRVQLDFSDERWYFWKIFWRTGQAGYEIRLDSPTGPVHFAMSLGTGDHQYRPVPHLVHIGAPEGRNGSIDASIPGMIVRDVWVSGRPRPLFPVFASPAGR
jgi:hypothetical protein